MATKNKIKFHPKASKRLITFVKRMKKELKRWPSMREIAHRRDVNQRYVADDLLRGIEPPDTTETGRVARLALFLRPFKPKPRRKPGDTVKHIPQWMAAWRRVPKEKRDALLKGLMENRLTVIERNKQQ